MVLPASVMPTVLSTMFLAFSFQYCALGCSKCLKCNAWPTVQLVGRSAAVKAKLPKRNYLAIKIEKVTVWVTSAWNCHGLRTMWWRVMPTWRLVYCDAIHVVLSRHVRLLNVFCKVSFIFCFLFSIFFFRFCCCVISAESFSVSVSLHTQCTVNFFFFLWWWKRDLAYVF